VVDDWLEAMNEGQVISVCFLDIQKCFDTINHEILLAKLSYYGIEGNEMQWFKSYLTDRRQQVICNGVVSNTSTVDIGVPQGSILGPFLFLLFVNDMGNFVHEGSYNCFADDTIIYTVGDTVDEANKKLQKCMKGVEKWYIGNKLKVNVNKSKTMFIGTRQRLAKSKINDFQIWYGNQVLERVTEMKYLGIIIDQYLLWDKQCNYIIRNIAHKLAMMKRMSSHLSEEILSIVYKTYIQPCLDYGATVWGYCSNEQLKRVQHMINLIARTVKHNFDFINTRGEDIVKELKWCTFLKRRDYLMSSLMYKCVFKKAPTYLCDNIYFQHELSERTTRATTQNTLYVPKPNNECLKRSFSYLGPVLWNSMPTDLRDSSSLYSYKKLYKTLYFI
jgi:hypothetical protein